MQLTGNTILITGGGSGIGRGLAEEFHKRGNTVIIAGRRENVLDDVAKANPGMKTAVLDVESAEAIASFARQLVQDYPQLNAVLHNAGVARPEKLASPEDVAIAEQTININLLGPMRLNAALLPHLLQQPHAAVLTVTSGLAFMALALSPSYCATKAGLHSWTESLRYQLKDTAVQVIEIAPPYVQTMLGGERQSKDPNAMPLADYIAETMALLESQPEAKEILVERVKPMRFAEKNGAYEGMFTQMNDMMSKARASH